MLRREALFFDKLKLLYLAYNSFDRYTVIAPILALEDDVAEYVARTRFVEQPATGLKQPPRTRRLILNLWLSSYA